MPRKAQEPLANIPPGPHRLEVRVNDRIVFLQRVHSYKIDQQSDQVVINGALRPIVEPSALKSEPVVTTPTAEMRFEAAGDVTKEETS